MHRHPPSPPPPPSSHNHHNHSLAHPHHQSTASQPPPPLPPLPPHPSSSAAQWSTSNTPPTAAMNVASYGHGHGHAHAHGHAQPHHENHHSFQAVPPPPTASTRPPPKKRNRQALSCTSCRERKIKCDRQIPCSQCIKRGDQALCHMEIKGQEGQKPSNNGNDSSEVDAIKSRLAQLEAYIAQRSDLSPPQSSYQAPTLQAPLPGPDQMTSRPFYSQTTLPPISAPNSSAGSSPAFSHGTGNGHFSPSGPHQRPGGFGSSNYFGGDGGRQLPSPVPHSGNVPSGSFLPHTIDSPARPASSMAFDGRPPLDGMPRHDRRNSLASVSGQSAQSAESRLPVTPARCEVDSDTEDAALVLEGLAMGGGRDRTMTDRCPKRSASDVIDKQPDKSFQRCLEADRKRDIMSLPSNDRAEQQDSEMEEAREVDAKCSTAQTPPEVDASRSTTTATAQKADANPATSESQDDKDAKTTSVIGPMCDLACRNTGLFRLKRGPETMLGWGIGWAWAAAVEAGDFDRFQPNDCEGSAEREAVLRVIIRSLPEKQIASQLVEIYENRVRFLAGHVVHLGCLRKEMDAFYALDSVEKRARVVNYVDPGWLSMFLMVLVLGLQFHPCFPRENWIPMDRLFDGKTIHAWHSAAKTCLMLARYQSSQSMSVLQAIILLNLYSADPGHQNLSLLRTAITNAQEMGLHRLGDKSKQPQPGENAGIVIRREVAKRIWWMLVFKDWCGAACSAAYTIQPSFFNTPLPGNYNDSDLCQTPTPPPHPRDEPTEMSFVLSNIEMAKVVRENVDLCNRRDIEGDGTDRRLSCEDVKMLDSRYREILEKAPHFFQVGSDAGAGTDLEVQRWLLQQGIFHKLLRLHRPNLSSRAKSRTSCVLLARSILDMQKKIRSRCTVADRLWINLMQSFSAAIVLCLDLLHSRQPPSMRVIIRSEIGEALKALRHVDSTNYTARKGIRVIEALMAEEEERWKQGGGDAGANNVDNGVAGSKRKRESGEAGGRKKDLLSLAMRVARAARCEPPLPDEQCQPTNCGESEMATGVGDPNEADENGASANGVARGADKDAISKELMEQLMKGSQPQGQHPSPVMFPWMNRIQQPATAFDRHSVAPNGLEFSMGATPPDGQSFDLSAFLAQCENSPSSSSDDASLLSSNGGGPLHTPDSLGQHSVGTSNTSVSNISGSAFQNGSGSSSTGGDVDDGGLSSSPSAPAPPTGMDSFWNWILQQGSVNVSGSNASQAPQGPWASTSNSMSSGGFALAPPASTSGALGGPGASGLGPLSPSSNTGAAAAATPSTPSKSAGVPGLPTISNGGFTGFGTSVGTPSAGVGGVPGLSGSGSGLAGLSSGMGMGMGAGTDSWLQWGGLYDLAPDFTGDAGGMGTANQGANSQSANAGAGAW